MIVLIVLAPYLSFSLFLYDKPSHLSCLASNALQHTNKCKSIDVATYLHVVVTMCSLSFLPGRANRPLVNVEQLVCIAKPSHLFVCAPRNALQHTNK